MASTVESSGLTDEQKSAARERALQDAARDDAIRQHGNLLPLLDPLIDAVHDCQSIGWILFCATEDLSAEPTDDPIEQCERRLRKLVHARSEYTAAAVELQKQRSRSIEGSDPSGRLADPNDDGLYGAELSAAHVVKAAYAEDWNTVRAVLHDIGSLFGPSDEGQFCSWLFEWFCNLEDELNYFKPLTVEKSQDDGVGKHELAQKSADGIPAPPDSSSASPTRPRQKRLRGKERLARDKMISRLINHEGKEPADVARQFNLNPKTAAKIASESKRRAT